MEFENQPAWSESFDRFYGYFAECFKREGTRRCAAVYWRGLLTEVERKNCWQLAEQMGEADPQPMQRLLYEAQWDEALMCQKLREGGHQPTGLCARGRPHGHRPPCG